MLQNEYLVAKFGFDTAENEPLKVWGLIQFNIQSSPCNEVVDGATGFEKQSLEELHELTDLQRSAIAKLGDKATRFESLTEAELEGLTTRH